MTKISIILVLLLTISGLSSHGQTDQMLIIEDFKPSSVNQPDSQYPQVNSEGRGMGKIIKLKQKF